MSELEVKAVRHLLGTSVPYAYAVKAGPWIFLTGHEAFDFETGITEAVAGAVGFPLYGRPRWRREGDFILQRMRRILEDLGSDLSHGVRLDQYYPTPAAVDPYHLARRAEFGDYIPPSSVIIERCFGAQTGISTSLMAVVPSREYEIQRVYPKDVTASASSGFVPTIICNDFVFVAGQMASGEGHGLDRRAHVPDHAAWGGTEIRKQTEFVILEKLKPALEAAGSSLEHSVKAQVYLQSAVDFPDFVEVWNQYYQNIPCALTVVPTKSFGMEGGIIEINLIALTNTAKREKQVISADVPAMAAYGPCVKVGEFLLPSGLMAVGRDGHVASRTLSPGFPGLSHAGYTQATTVHDYADALCKVAGTSLAKVLRAQYFLSDVAAFPGVAMTWSSRFGDQPLPFVCVQTPPTCRPRGRHLLPISGYHAWNRICRRCWNRRWAWTVWTRSLPGRVQRCVRTC
jgi:enamine deaminase RidA (YjgF/YER057c/UK114 family)